ncbi:Sec34-like family-domain-containing protein [Cercophora scortea]|uniref:Conserved oligomeric Golgi complex subunit 3 n=1 Tax=Cercophora scortea TaxID=314031 RepID=A0AAE0I3T1_9PEZI|nr:Sec34-like family-domain-containing protein [Cercophora scortea]
MYEDSWYSFVPEFQQPKRGGGGSTAQTGGHRRKESLLQQPNGTIEHADAAEPLPALFEDTEDANSPPQATLSRRAKSYSDFYDIATAQLTTSTHGSKKKRRRRPNTNAWEALSLSISELHTGPSAAADDDDADNHDVALTGALLEASQQEYLLYHDQLAMTERHLGTLVEDANSALEVLESLCQSFRAVEDQTTSFQAQCDDLLSEQKRLQTLADEVGTDLHYYAYLENVTRRLNGPGASRLVDDDAFGDVLGDLDSCIAFMTKNPLFRDAESYLARYQALLTKALHILEVGFTNRLEKVSVEVSRQIAATQSESARHALAYGRFEEILMESYSLIPNVQRVALSAYEQNGQAKLGQNFDTYSNTANNLFYAYWTVRDRDLKPIVQHELNAFKTEAKDTSIETASRNFVKQCLERSYNEAALFWKIFSVEPQYSTDPKSAFTALKSQHGSLVTGVNIAPIATNLQQMLQTGDLPTICSVIGWITNEYMLLDYDEEETPFAGHCREVASRLLTEHLWAVTDAFFEAEVAKSISKAVIALESLKIGPIVNSNAAANGFPPVKRAVELLGMFDQSMPKERCQRNSPVVFKIVKEAIAALHRAEVRIKSTKNGTDSDLFMIKNLLILKNELLSLEIGDVRSQAEGMQYFGHILDTLSPQNLIGLLSSFTTYIPGSSLWSSRVSTPAPGTGGTSTPSGGAARGGAGGNSLAAAAVNEIQDAGEQLDELLRQSIYAFTRRWATAINDAKTRKLLGGNNLAKVEKELNEMLDWAFASQPEVVAKLKEAIEIDALAQSEEKGRAKGGNRAR